MALKTQSRLKPRIEQLERREVLSAAPQLVANLNSGPPSEQLQIDNAWLADELIFAADDGSGDVELWKSDGTSKGTTKIKDIRPGPQSSMPRDFTLLNDRMLFTAYSGLSERELWVTDGTEAGTVMLSDMKTGPRGSSVASLTVAGGKAYFQNDGSLWVTDGTDAGTQIMAGYVRNLIAVGDRVYSISGNGDAKDELRVTDGTSVGTKVLKVGDGLFPITSVDSVLYFTMSGRLWRTDGTDAGTMAIRHGDLFDQMYLLNDRVLFTTFNQFSGATSLWSTDGTDDAVRVNIGSRDMRGEAVVVGDKLLFVENGRQIWVTDGTTQGSKRIKSLQEAWILSSFGDQVALVVNGNQLWTSNGTTEGTSRLLSFDGGISGAREVDDKLLLYGVRGDKTELWSTDGTAAGSSMLESFDQIGNLRARNGKLYFWGSRDNESDLWWTDGTQAGTQRFRDLSDRSDPNAWLLSDRGEKRLFWSGSDESRGLWGETEKGRLSRLSSRISGPSGSGSWAQMIELNGKAYFYDGVLWEVNGSSPIRHDYVSGASQLVGAGSHLYYVSDSPSEEIWRTDGSEDGTLRLSSGGEDGFQNPRNLTIFNGELYFLADGTDGWSNLWKFDAVQSKAVVVKDSPNSLSGATYDRTPIAVVGKELYFTFQKDQETELWRIGDKSSEPESVVLLPLAGVNLMAGENQLYLQSGGELWRSDGTSAGTYPLIHDGARNAQVSDDRLFFVRYTDYAGDELWATDGTVDGTHMVRDIIPGQTGGCGGSQDKPMIAVDGKLFFTAIDGNGIEGLWVSDGTNEGTNLLKQTRVTPVAGGNNMMYFRTSDLATGNELWQSDGTEEGTVLVADLNPGRGSSSKYYYGSEAGTAAEIGGRLYFTGDDGFHGNSLWQIPLDSPSPRVVGDANGDGRFDSADFVKIFLAGEYEDLIEDNSTWEEGDFDGDCDVTSKDLIFAFLAGTYVTTAQPSASTTNRVSWLDWTDDSDQRKERKFLPNVVDQAIKPSDLGDGWEHR